MISGIVIGIVAVFTFAATCPGWFCALLVLLGLGRIFGVLGNTLQK